MIQFAVETCTNDGDFYCSVPRQFPTMGEALRAAFAQCESLAHDFAMIVMHDPRMAKEHVFGTLTLATGWWTINGRAFLRQIRGRTGGPHTTVYSGPIGELR